MLDDLATRLRCMHVARVLQSYLDGEVTPPTARAVEDHLEECRRCGLEARTYLAIKAALAAADQPASELEERRPVDSAAVRRLTEFALRLAADGPPPRPPDPEVP